jgi:hypothetical protein
MEIESYNIYRESSQANVYFKIGSIGPDDMNEFTDPVADPSGCSILCYFRFFIITPAPEL